MWLLGGAQSSVAIVSEGESISYGELGVMVEEFAHRYLGREGVLVAILAEQNLRTIVAYLASFATPSTVMMVDPQYGPDVVGQIVDAYEPQLVVGAQSLDRNMYCESEPYHWTRRTNGASGAVSTKLVMLTSGSMGAPKGVALGEQGVHANTLGTINRLELNAQSRAITSLPLHYAFGLSVLHSHLAAGGSLVVTESRPTSRQFWSTLSTSEVTHLPGVSFMYELLQKLFLKRWPTSLRQLSHSGGRLHPEIQRRYLALALQHGSQFFLMYGQTELMTRISAFDLTRRPDKLGSVGVPLDEIEVATNDGELVVKSPSVMQGYVDSARAIRNLDQFGTSRDYHHTGDLGIVDDDGFIWITGRAGRTVKQYGKRVSLDEIEEYLQSERKVAVISSGSQIVICMVGKHNEPDELVMRTARALRLPPASLAVASVPEIPLTSRGKVHYAALSSLVESRDGSVGRPSAEAGMEWT
ncbi:class I adenylate-forming enzyme family protein [Rhodococcus pyridinivorans]|uniref:AMP-binding protein n=1 Tax=Rhodococcus pyridinivorans TaxID=103816 RepID=A0A7M2XWS7_9NOCA|nr:AMP-binding protein [Rhodococcus pyridinivorans]QOW02038.1 AMP-binding protein [Rhodococcus pyridinivorans]